MTGANALLRRDATDTTPRIPLAKLVAYLTREAYVNILQQKNTMEDEPIRGVKVEPKDKIPVEISAAICFGVMLGYALLFIVSLFIT